MVDSTRGNDRPETTGSDSRPARRIEGPSFVFHLPSEIASLKAEQPWISGDRNARTLVHEEGLRVVALALKDGARMDEHQAGGWVSIYVQRGRVRIKLANETLDVTEGNVTVLRHNIRHAVEALEESELMLTMSSPEA